MDFGIQGTIVRRAFSIVGCSVGVFCCLLAGTVEAVLVQDDWQQDYVKGTHAANAGQLSGTPSDNLEFRFDSASAADKPARETLLLLRSGRVGEAVAKARELVKGYPRWASAHELLGAALVMQGDLEGGLKSLQEAVALNGKQYTAMVKMGDVYRAQGKSADAKKKYLDAVRIAPTDRLANQRLGLMAEEEGDSRSAIDFFQKGIVGVPPGYVGIKVNLGRLYNASGQFNKTIELLQPVVPLSSRDATAQIVLGTALVATGRAEDGIRAFERAKAIDPKQAGYRLVLGMAYRQAGANDKALAELTEANRLNPDWPIGLLQLGNTLAASGRPKEALETYRKAEKFATGSALTDVRGRIGSLQLATKDFPGAIATFKQLTAGQIPPVEAVAGLAQAFQLNGQSAEAESSYREVTRLAPKDPNSFLRLGLFYGYQRRYRDALAALNDGLNLDMNQPALLRAVVLMQSRLGRHDDAVSSAERLVKVEPRNPDAQVLLAMMLDEAGKRSRAKDVYERLLAKGPNNIVAQNNLAMLLSAEGKHDLAMQAAKRATALKPGDPMLMDTLGWVLHQAGKSKEGLATLTKAAAVGPAFPSIHYHLGVVYQSLGDERSARAEFDKALALAADFAEAEDARKRRAALH